MAAKARLGGISEVQLDISDDFALRLSKDVAKLSDLNQIKVEGALRTSLDFSEVNDAVFVEFLTPLTTNRRRSWIDVVVEVERLPTSFTRLYVIGKRNDARQWDIELALPDDHWIELASQKKINTIDFGGYTLNKANVLTSWDYAQYDGDNTPTQDGSGWNGAYGWWPADVGGWVDQKTQQQNEVKPVKMMAVEDLRPHVNYGYLLKRGFCEIGWTLGGVILETAWSRSIWLYLLKAEYYLGKGYDGVQYGKYCRIIGRIITGAGLPGGVGLPITDLGGGGPFIYFTVLDYVGSPGAELLHLGGPDKYLCGIQNPLPFTAKYKLSFKFTIRHLVIFSPTTYHPAFRIYEVDPNDSTNSHFTGQILSADDAVFELNPGEDKFVAFDFDIQLEPGQKCALHFTGGFAGIILPGFWFRCEQDNQALTREDEVDLRTCLDENLNLLDMLKAYVHLTNGRMETDYRTKALNIYPENTSPVYAELVQGFIRDDLPAIDINALLVPDSIKITFLRPNLKRYTLLAFADSNDAYIDEIAPTLTEPLHSRKILNGEDLPNETDERKNPVFEPTAEGQSALLKQNEFTIVNRPDAPTPYLPRYWDNTDGDRSFDIGPRILFAFGLIRQKNPAPLATTDLYANFFFDEYVNATELFGYATQLRTWDVTPFSILDGSVVFGRTANDLFVNFYLGLTNDNRGGATIDVLQRMTMAQYNSYNFRRLFFFNYEGRALRVPMTGIRDFQSGLTTPVTYFASPVETECCDLPCSCRFTECEYYQDLGLYIQQGTVDDLAITSFTIDNVQQLTAPVPLGQLNIVDIGGGSYVTNLVDALNSVGAPYFAFSYSTRMHATKGLRFFKIKRPTCQSFEIIISNVGDEVYRYTESEQQEQWFAGTWGAIGYGGETYTAPDNCETRIEY